MSVALPVHQDAATLASAVACLTRQTLRDIEILLLLNGSDVATRVEAARLAGTDRRIRILTLERASLAAALNLALREARSDLVARMDADDMCSPRRLELQAAEMREHPELAALGCRFEILDSAGRQIAHPQPPRDPREAAWRLHLLNPFAHGSMLLRRPVVLEAGGYDETLDRAQDHDLWLRLCARRGVAAIEASLYTHRLRDLDSFSSSPLQAWCAAGVLSGAWSRLPAGDPGVVQRAIAAAMQGHPELARSILAEEMNETGPALACLTAWLWVGATIPPMGRRALETCRSARVREVAASLRRSGIEQVWLYGAGAHTGRLLDDLATTGISIAGLIDDAAADTVRHGRAVQSPGSVPRGATVVLSSDVHEDRLWERSAALRERGVGVIRLYG